MNKLETASRVFASASAIAMVLCLMATARAQTSANSTQIAQGSGNESLDEVIVTAQRRSENLQDVPIAVTAISPKEIYDLNLVTIQDIQLVTPALVFSSGYNFAQPFIRGVGTSDPTAGVESAVASYIDGAYLERAEAEIVDLFDMSGVQVLKGAQGVLWGRNATGGAILYTTNDPQLNKYSTSATGEYGSYNHGLGQVVTNIPVSDTLAIRLGFRESYEEGYITNLAGGPKLGGRQSETLRGKIKWQPTGNFSAVLAVEGYRAIDRNNAQRETAEPPLCTSCEIPIPGANLNPVAAFYNVAQTLTATPFYTNGTNANLRLNYEGDNFSVSSVSYYRHELTNVVVNEGLSSTFPLFDYHAGDGGHTLGQDFTMSTHFPGMFNGLAGVSYMYDDSYDYTGATGLAFEPLLTYFGSYPVLEDAVTTKSAAGFAELYVTPLDKLKLTLGARYTSDSRSITGIENEAANAGFTPPGSPLAYSEHADFSKLTPRVVAAYDLTPINIYASWNRGFKAGGYDTPSFTPPNAVKSEVIDNYELGAKYESPDRKLRVNAAAFYYKYTDIQVYIVDIASGGQILQNAAGANGKGGELDGNYQVTGWLSTFGSLAYLDAKYTSYPDASIVNPTATGLVQGTANLTGQALTRSPTWSGAAGFSVHSFISDDWRANLSTVGHFTSWYYFYPDAGGPLGHDIQPGYALVNITGDMEHQNSGAAVQSTGLKDYKIGFYLNNATNKKYYQLRLTSSGFGLDDQVAPPITFGLRVSADF